MEAQVPNVYSEPFSTMFTFLLFLGGAILAFHIGSFYHGPWAATARRHYDVIANLAELQSGQVFCDAGCGTASLLVYMTRKYNVRAIGFEVSPFLYLLARLRTVHKPNVTVRFGDFSHHVPTEADTIYAYLLPGQYRKVFALFKRVKGESGGRPQKLITAYWPVSGTVEPQRIGTANDGTKFYVYEV